MGAGRFVCVAMPLALTIASIVCILMVMLGGITDKNLTMFELRTQNLSISSSSLESLVDLATRNVDLDLKKLTNEALNKGEDVVNAAKNAGIEAGTNAIDGGEVTAKDLDLADYYKVALWNYCSWTDGKRDCTKAKFDWAHDDLNNTEAKYTVAGKTVQLPKEVRAAVKTFITVSKWTQVVYIIAIITAAIELVFGFFAICSRIGSCCTYIVSAIATVTIIAASILATVQASVVTGAAKSTAKAYNVNASINTRFLAVTWLAVAFSIGAGLFWLFTICCCASSDKSSKKSSGSKKGFMGKFANRSSKHSDHEKLIPTGSYQRVGDEHTGYVGNQHGLPMRNVQPMARGGNGAYEPFAHTRV